MSYCINKEDIRKAGETGSKMYYAERLISSLVGIFLKSFTKFTYTPLPELGPLLLDYSSEIM
jgi:hypothetical protein